MLLERGDVRINEDCAQFGDRSFRIAEVDGAEVSSSQAPLSLSWLLFGLLAAITAFQAGLDHHSGLWAIAAALMLLAIIKWRQRRPATVYKLTVEAAGERTAVLETADRAEVHLIRDAMQMAVEKLIGTNGVAIETNRVGGCVRFFGSNPGRV